jgi:hypothetical protein
LADPGRAAESLAIPVALDRVEHPFCLGDSGRVVVASQEPETATPVLVHELADRGVSFG